MHSPELTPAPVTWELSAKLNTPASELTPLETALVRWLESGTPPQQDAPLLTLESVLGWFEGNS